VHHTSRRPADKDEQSLVVLIPCLHYPYYHNTPSKRQYADKRMRQPQGCSAAALRPAMRPNAKHSPMFPVP
jgi:hypothetical protein